MDYHGDMEDIKPNQEVYERLSGGKSALDETWIQRQSC